MCRGNDTSGLKYKALYYVDIKLDNLEPAIPFKNLNDKAFRGWNHPVLARALLPLMYEPTDESVHISSHSHPTEPLWLTMVYNRNIASAGAHDGDVETHHHVFARWLYPNDAVFDANDENDGLFQGHYLIYVSHGSISEYDVDKPDIYRTRYFGISSRLLAPLSMDRARASVLAKGTKIGRAHV